MSRPSTIEPAEAALEQVLSDHIYQVCQQIRAYPATASSLIFLLGGEVRQIRQEHELRQARAEVIASAERRVAAGEPPGEVHTLLRWQLDRLQPGGGVAYPVCPGADIQLGPQRKAGPVQGRRQMPLRLGRSQ